MHLKFLFQEIQLTFKQYLLVQSHAWSDHAWSVHVINIFFLYFPDKKIIHTLFISKTNIQWV